MKSTFSKKTFLLLLSALIVLVAFGLWREVRDTLRVKRQIKKIETQANELESKNANLKQLVDYLHSTEYQERRARENLNLQAPGEVAVALPEQDLKSENSEASQMNKSSETNFTLWWDYFFGTKK